MKDYVQAEKEIIEKPLRGPIEPIAQSCSTDEIDKILNSPDLQLKVSYKVPLIYYVSTFVGCLDPHPPVHKHNFSTEDKQKIAIF